MQLSFTRPFLSIVDFPAQALPTFSVITGINGAGKSHFLKAVQAGAIACDFAPAFAQEIRLFDWTNLSPNDEGEFGGDVIRQEHDQLFNQVKALLDQPWGLNNVRSSARALGLRGEILADPYSLFRASKDDLEEACETEASGEQLHQQVAPILQNLERTIKNHLAVPQQEMLEHVARSSNRPLFALRKSDFHRAQKPNWGQTNLFQQSFARLFVSYRDLKLLNGVATLAKARGREDAPALTEEQFQEKYGLPPWDFVNESLIAAGLDFRIDVPDEFSFTGYRPTLHKHNSPVEITFEGLSSGEKVLMSFAFAVYYANDSRQEIGRPKVLLLDEVDAPLHPRMCKSLLSTIEEVLVKSYGLSVIMTTHSPTTVALAPEEAIHIVEPGVPGVRKISKDAALSHLVSGLPTLSISYDGRRQVFVESPTDAEVYQSLFSHLVPFINNTRSIVFISTGVKKTDGIHYNTGCSVVKRIVGEMRAAGARSTFGLIDWDGVNENEDGIHVLGIGERNGLESVVLDPLLLLYGLMHERSGSTDSFGLDRSIRYMQMNRLDHHALQTGINNIQERVLGRDLVLDQESEYVGGMSLLLDREFTTMDDHLLEERVLTSFPQLKAVSRGRLGGLVKWIAQTIIPDSPQSTPKAVLRCFENILGAV